MEGTWNIGDVHRLQTETNMFRRAQPVELDHYMSLLVPGVPPVRAARELWQPCSRLAPPRTVEKSRRLMAAVFDHGEPWPGNL